MQKANFLKERDVFEASLPPTLRFAGMPSAEEACPSPDRHSTPAMEVAGLGGDEAEAGNPVGQLQELCQHKFWPQPYYSFAMETGPFHNREFSCDVTLWKWSVQGKCASSSNSV